MKHTKIVPFKILSMIIAAAMIITFTPKVAFAEDNSEYLTIKDGIVTSCDTNVKGDVVIPEGVTGIADGAFSHCKGLKSVEIPEGITEIKAHTFDECAGLLNVKIPESVTTIGEYAFQSCDTLNTITIPGRVKSINEGAFILCKKLTTVNMSNSVTKIGDYAFASSMELTINFEGNKAEWDNISKGQESTCENTKIITTSTDWYNHWGKEYISSAMDKGWVIRSAKFRPDDPITRAEFVKIVNRAFGYTEKTDIKYKDVETNAWYYDEVRIAAKAGYISTALLKFRPNDNISREEAAAIVTSIMNNKNNNFDKIKKYEDYRKISLWAKTSVAGAVEAGYMGVGVTKLNPTDNITRAEALATLSRVK